MERIVIPQGIQTIAYATFSNCKSLQEIVIPDSVTTLEWYAFRYCKSLRYIKLSDGKELGFDSTDPEIVERNDEIVLSSETLEGLETFRDRLAKALPQEKPVPLVADLIKKGDIVICVCPIDAAAPKGRLILPQQQTIRDILEAGAVSVVTRHAELEETLKQSAEKI